MAITYFLPTEVEYRSSKNGRFLRACNAVPVAGARRRASEFTVGEVTIDVRILVTTTGSGIPSRFHLIYSPKKGVNIVSTGRPGPPKGSPQYEYFAY
jgi:hypothetical protein